jgi:hypothetical protein
LTCSLRLAQNEYFSLLFFHLIGLNLFFIFFFFFFCFGNLFVFVFLTSSYDFFIEIYQLIVIICSLKYVWVTWLFFFFTNKINVHSMSTNLVYTLLCCLSLNFDPCICSVFMIQVSAYIWNHPSTGCIRVCQDHTKSQIIAGAIIVKQLVKKQFTHPNLNIFSIFFFFVGWIFNDFSVSFWGSFQVLHWNRMNCKRKINSKKTEE